ncbi:MAG: flagellar assembly protein FliW [Atribacterota bacterium]|nr:flagellar assembly protein FliW [Atribacterota bacterium]
MNVKTRYFGEIEVGEKEIILFPWGIPGFEHLRRFILLEEKAFFWLQSVDEEAVVFAVCDPFLYFPGYEVEIPSVECDILGLSKESDVVILAIMNFRSSREIGVNLLAPIVINCKLRIGKQIILEDTKYGLCHLLTLEKTATG